MRATYSSPVTAVSEHLRPLKWNEMVRRGDFVKDGKRGFEPWDGPNGFRADSFVKQIYRHQKLQTEGAKNSP